MNFKNRNPSNTTSPMVKQLYSSNNINEDKLTFDKFMKFMEDNKQYLMNPHFSDVPQPSEKFHIVVPEIENKQLNINDSEEITNLPLNLSNIFKDCLLIKIGVLNNIKHLKSNISILSSILTCLHNSFNSKQIAEQSSYINYIYGKLNKSFSNNQDIINNYKQYSWTKNTVEKDLKDFNVNSITLKIISDYFHVNIFVLNFADDNLSYIGGHCFVPFKKNIFLSYLDDIFNPIFFNEDKFLCNGSTIINKLLNNKLSVKTINFDFKSETLLEFKILDENLKPYLVEPQIHIDYKTKLLMMKMGMSNHLKPLPINTQIDKPLYVLTLPPPVIPLEILTNKSEKVIIKKLEETNTDCYDDDESDNNDCSYKKNDLDLKKVQELKEIATKLNLDIKNDKNKLKTKQQLIQEILNYKK